MRALWVLGLAAFGCGGTAQSGAAPSGGAAGYATENGGTEPASAGAAGSLAGSANAGAGAGGERGVFTPCGGTLVGDWGAHAEPSTEPPPSDVDACFRLKLQRLKDGSLGATASNVWINYHAAPRVTLLRFKPIDANAPTGALVYADAFIGPVDQHFGNACLADGQGKATCEELAGLLEMIGLGLGSFNDVHCDNDGAAGGCTCHISVQEVGGGSGSWAPDPNDATRVLLSRPNLQDSLNMDAFNVPYCANAASLQLGAEATGALRSASPLAFERESCSDGVQGPIEAGVDCGGLACSINNCP